LQEHREATAGREARALVTLVARCRLSASRRVAAAAAIPFRRDRRGAVLKAGAWSSGSGRGSSWRGCDPAT
jgi:hypothetical protein